MKLPTTVIRTISTHALTWSATCESILIGLGGSNFNSRTHVECDFSADSAGLAAADFNSRTHVECDLRKFPACAV